MSSFHHPSLRLAMLFSSTTFLFLFLPLILIANLLAPKSCRNAVLVGGSLFFYAWGETFYVLIMLVSIYANYRFGRRLNEHPSKKILMVAVATNLGLLTSFKYANFAVDSINSLSNLDKLLCTCRSVSPFSRFRVCPMWLMCTDGTSGHKTDFWTLPFTLESVHK